MIAPVTLLALGGLAGLPRWSVQGLVMAWLVALAVWAGLRGNR